MMLCRIYIATQAMTTFCDRVRRKTDASLTATIETIELGLAIIEAWTNWRHWHRKNGFFYGSTMLRRLQKKKEADVYAVNCDKVEVKLSCSLSVLKVKVDAIRSTFIHSSVSCQHKLFSYLTFQHVAVQS